MYHKFQTVLDDIEDHLNSGEPFSLLRVGDGDLKLLWDIRTGRVNSVKFQRSGVPLTEREFVIKIYKDGCNNANYTSSFQVYNTKRMWKRKFSKGTKIKVKNWKNVYKNIGITNSNFCSPDINFLLFLKDIKNNLFNQMKDKRVCLITCYKNVQNKLLRAGINIESEIIPAIGNGHYKVYENKVERFQKMIRDNRFDLFLNAAGALGKGYSYHIKDAGGICIDIGNVAQFWNNQKIVYRYNNILTHADPYTFKLTGRGEKFRKFL